jgi:hypothetical protein
MKTWYSSKTFWLGVLIVIGGIAEFIAGVPAGASIPTIIAGCLSVIIRFLTGQPITKPAVLRMFSRK